MLITATADQPEYRKSNGLESISFILTNDMSSARLLRLGSVVVAVGTSPPGLISQRGGGPCSASPHRAHGRSSRGEDQRGRRLALTARPACSTAEHRWSVGAIRCQQTACGLRRVAGVLECARGVGPRGCLRDLYTLNGQYSPYGQPELAGRWIDGLIEDCREARAAGVRSVARTLKRWRGPILAWHTTGASNGPTEGLNSIIKKVKRVGTGFRSFTNYRLRILLAVGGCTGRSSTPHPGETRRSL